MGRAQAVPRQIHTFGSSSASQPSFRPLRRLTLRQQRALDELNALGANLRADFTPGELRTVFRTLARRYHPDSHPAATRAEASRLSRVFADVTTSYRCLATFSHQMAEAA
jgi:hypothetical protein